MRLASLLTASLATILAMTTPSAAQAPATGATAGGGEFRYAYRVDPASLDPHALAETFTLSFLGQIYEPLVGRGKNLELVPALATRWEQPDPQTWRFHLRRDAAFSDGTPFTADDVVFSLRRVKMDGADMAYTVTSVTDIRKVDDHTVDLVTAQPNPILPLQITSTYIMSRAWAERHGATAPASVKAKVENYASNNANGTGPFMIESRQAGVRTVLVRNPNWRGEAPNLGRVVFTPIQSDATRVAALLSGEVDMAYPVPQQDVPRIEANAGTRVLKGFELRTIFLNMDQKRDELLGSDVKGKNPFKDRRVRQAVYQAINIDAIRDRIMGGSSHVAGTMIAPGINGYDPRLDVRAAPYDPDAAKKLLAEAGYPQGFAFPMDCSNDRYVNDERICQAVVGMLGRVGLKVSLNAQTRTKFFEKVLGRDTAFAMIGWQPLSYDAHSTMQDTMSTPADKIGTYNIGGYSNPKVDELTRQIETEVDPARRNALIVEAMGIDKQDYGHIPLHQAGLAWGVRAGVDVVQRSDDSLELRWVRVEPRAAAQR